MGGLRAGGGAEVGIKWSGGKLAGETLESDRAEKMAVRYAGKEVTMELAGARRW